MLYLSKNQKIFIKILSLLLNSVKKKYFNKVIQSDKDSIKTCLVINQESGNYLSEVMEGD